MPSRHDLINLVGKCAFVCCEMRFASTFSVSMEWHALCVFHNHGWESISNDMEDKKVYQQVILKRVTGTHVRDESTSVMSETIADWTQTWNIFKRCSEQAYPDWALHSCPWSPGSRCRSPDCSQCQNPQTAVAACGLLAQEASTYTKCYWGRCPDSSERPRCRTLCPSLYVHSHRLNSNRGTIVRLWRRTKGESSLRQLQDMFNWYDSRGDLRPLAVLLICPLIIN